MHDYERTTLFIDGRWVTPGTRDVIEVVDPATEKVIGCVPDGTAADVDAAASAARRAFDPLISVAERRERVARVIEVMEKRLPDIAEKITTEMGAPVRSLYPRYCPQHAYGPLRGLKRRSLYPVHTPHCGVL